MKDGHIEEAEARHADIAVKDKGPMDLPDKGKCNTMRKRISKPYPKSMKVEEIILAGIYFFIGFVFLIYFIIIHNYLLIIPWLFVMRAPIIFYLFRRSYDS